MNPHDTSDDNPEVKRTQRQTETAVVQTTTTNGPSEDSGHVVEIEPQHVDGTEWADVPVDTIGDVHIPRQGDTVLIERREGGQPTVIGIRYSRSDTVPEYEPGQRRLGHSETDSHTLFDTDGTILVENDAGVSVELRPDGKVVINGGTKKPLTDVTLETTTDSDGHVTDVTVTKKYSDTVRIP